MYQSNPKRRREGGREGGRGERERRDKTIVKCVSSKEHDKAC